MTNLVKIPTGYGVGSLETDIIRTVVLDEISYDLRFRWNTRDESWTMYCSKSGGDNIFTTKVTCQRVLNELYKYKQDCPQGNFVVLDMSFDTGRVDFEGFTNEGRFRLFYESII